MSPVRIRPGTLGLFLAVLLPVAGLLVAVLAVLGDSSRGEAVAVAVPLAVLFAFLALGAGYSCRVLPLSRALAGKTATTHGITAVVATSLWVGLARLLAFGLDRAGLFPGVPLRVAELAGPLMVLGILLYLLAVAMHYLAAALEESRRAEQRVLQADLAAREAELNALKAQIDPHFLFNSLNSINSLIGRDPEGARRACAGLGDLMRQTLQLGRRHRVALQEDLGLVRRYLELEKVRLGERLQVEERVDPGTCTVTIPPLLLQPLVENAIKHGIASRVEGGLLTLETRLEGDRVQIRVSNPAGGGGKPPGTGTGLRNLRKRLEAEYGAAAGLRIDRSGSLYSARLDLPAGGRHG